MKKNIYFPYTLFIFSLQTWIILVVTLVMAFILAQQPTRAQTSIGNNGVIDALPPAQWYEVPNSKMDSVVPAKYHKSPIRAVSGPSSIMNAWGGGTLDTKRNRLIVWGGGHTDYAGNELYAFDLNSLKWHRLTDASNPPALDTEMAEDGNPVSRHTYGGLAYLANLDSFFGHGGSKYRSGGGTDTAWLFNFRTNKWEQKARGAHGGHSNTAEYDPNTGTVIVLSGNNLSRFDPVNNIWTQISGDNGGLGSLQHGAFDPTRNQFILLGSDKPSSLYKIAERGSNLSKITFTGATEFLKEPYPGIVYVAATDKYYGWSGGQNIYEITPDTWDIKLLPVASGSATPTVRNLNGTYGRFDYSPSKNAFIAVNRSSDNIFIFKLDLDKTVVRPTPIKLEPRLSTLDSIFPRVANTSLSAITVGELTQDGATTETLSLYLPVNSGDTDDDAVAIVEYRKTGNAGWNQALDLFKHDLTLDAPFSGMIFSLKPDTSYDVRVTIEDPDGGSVQQIKTMRTKAIPKITKATQLNTVNVSNSLELHSALDSAIPGQVILLAPGTYDDNFRITNRNGTAVDPITIRGADNFSSVIDGWVMINDSNFIHVEGMHITHSTHGIQIRDWGPEGDGTIGNVIRGNFISNVEIGIVAKSNGRTGPGHNNLYIVDNVLEGTNVYGDVSRATWNDEGIAVVGKNIEVAYNTLSGFGDSLGLGHTDRTASVDIHHNYVIYGGDDGVELDFAVRNVVARENLIANTGDGFSTQYIQKGPAYTYKNIIYNVLPTRGPFKIKPEALCNSGVFHFNNTSLNAGRAWINHSGCGKDINLYNNLFTGDRTEKDILRLDTSRWGKDEITVDYNAYIYDGLMQFGHEFFTTFAQYKSSSKNGNHDVLIMTDPVFRNAPIFSPQELLGAQKNPLDKDFRLAANSNAINAGKILPTITDGFVGSGPDIGAYESNDPAIKFYGARNNSITSFTGSTLTILVTQVEDILYRIEMSLIEAATLTFRVTAAELATSTDVGNVAIFANNILTIPKVTVGSSAYRVEMTLIDSETITFSVSEINIFPQSG